MQHPCCPTRPLKLLSECFALLMLVFRLGFVFSFHPFFLFFVMLKVAPSPMYRFSTPRCVLCSASVCLIFSLSYSQSLIFLLPTRNTDSFSILFPSNESGGPKNPFLYRSPNSHWLAPSSFLHFKYSTSPVVLLRGVLSYQPSYSNFHFMSFPPVFEA